MIKNVLDRIVKLSTIEGDCIRWIGATNSKGRPCIMYEGKVVSVSRLIMHLRHGFDLKSDKHILHKNECNLRIKCINDQHLYIGDQVTNSGDYSDDTTHCVHGHEFTQRILDINQASIVGLVSVSENGILDNLLPKSKSA